MFTEIYNVAVHLYYFYIFCKPNYFKSEMTRHMWLDNYLYLYYSQIH